MCLNKQKEHHGIDFNRDNLNEYLTAMENNIKNRKYIEIHHTEFEILFNLIYRSSKQFQNFYDSLDQTNYHRISYNCHFVPRIFSGFINDLVQKKV